jgi:hypothetical protein
VLRASGDAATRAAPNSQKRKEATRSHTSHRRESKVEELTRELHEALQQQAATSEVLHIISGSPSDVSVVFQNCWRTQPASAMLNLATSIGWRTIRCT